MLALSLSALAVKGWRWAARTLTTPNPRCISSAGKRRCDEPTDPRCAAKHCTFHCSLYCGGACVRVWEARERTRTAVEMVEGASPPRRKPPAARLVTRDP